MAGVEQGTPHVYVRDASLGATTLVDTTPGGAPGSSVLDGSPTTVAISRDGRYISFDSNADDLVANDPNEFWDVFVAPNP